MNPGRVEVEVVRGHGVPLGRRAPHRPLVLAIAPAVVRRRGRGPNRDGGRALAHKSTGMLERCRAARQSVPHRDRYGSRENKSTFADASAYNEFGTRGLMWPPKA